MKFNRHLNLEGKHAFLGASKYSWLNYDEHDLIEAYNRSIATQRGTELHDLASRLIKLGVRLPRQKRTLNMYVNDAIGFKMTPEQPLYFSDNCFGTADAISFRDSLLRIHDLKTGEKPGSMHQLEIYASLFCLEYNVVPSDIGVELRIYQSNDIDIYNPDPKTIQSIMKQIIRFDKKIEKMKLEV